MEDKTIPLVKYGQKHTKITHL